MVARSKSAFMSSPRLSRAVWSALAVDMLPSKSPLRWGFETGYHIAVSVRGCNENCFSDSAGGCGEFCPGRSGHDAGCARRSRRASAHHGAAPGLGGLAGRSRLGETDPGWAEDAQFQL